MAYSNVLALKCNAVWTGASVYFTEEKKMKYFNFGSAGSLLKRDLFGLPLDWKFREILLKIIVCQFV